MFDVIKYFINFLGIIFIIAFIIAFTETITDQRKKNGTRQK